MSTSKDLRKELFANLKALKQQKISIQEANESTKIASAINQSIRFDIENKRENIKLMKAMSKEKYQDLKVTPITL